MLRWTYRFDRKKFLRSAASVRHCPDKVLVAKLDNSPYWFFPEKACLLTYQLKTFQRHVRRLAHEYGAQHVLVTTLEKSKAKRFVRFQKIATAFKDRRGVEWEWIFMEQDAETMEIRHRYPSEVFPHLRDQGSLPVVTVPSRTV